MKKNKASNLLAVILLSLSSIGLHAQITQTYTATSENFRIYGASQLQANGNEIVGGQGVVRFGGISNGQIYGSIDTHSNPTDTPNSQRGSVFYDLITFDHTFISRVPTGDSSADYYSILGVSGNGMLASRPDGSGGTNYYYHTPADGYTQLARPSWVTGPVTNVNSAGLSGQYIVGSTLHFSGSYQNNGFLYDTTTGAYTQIFRSGSLGTGLTGIAGNTVLGNYSYQDGGLYRTGYFLYDIAMGTYNDLSLGGFTPEGISDGYLFGTVDDSAAYYDLADGTLTLLDLSTLPSGQAPSGMDEVRITGIEGNTIVGNIMSSENSTGFVMTVPEPSGVILITVTGLLGILRRRRPCCLS